MRKLTLLILLFSISIAASLALPKFEAGKRYHIVCQQFPNGCVADGASVGQNTPLYYLQTANQSDEAAWVIIKVWDEAYAIQNAKTGQYITYDGIRQDSPELRRYVSMADDEDYWSFRDQVYHDFFHLADRSSILQISGRLKDEKDQAGRTLDILDSRISIMLKDRLEGNIQHTADLPGNWIRFAEKAPLSDFSNLLGQIQKARVMLQSSVNYQAVIEQLLLSFVGEYSKWQT